MWIEFTKHNGDRVFINMNLASDFSQSRLSANTIINMAGSNGGSNKIEVTEDI